MLAFERTLKQHLVSYTTSHAHDVQLDRPRLHRRPLRLHTQRRACVRYRSARAYLRNHVRLAQPYTQGELTSQYLWQRYGTDMDRDYVTVTPCKLIQRRVFNIGPRAYLRNHVRLAQPTNHQLTNRPSTQPANQ